VGGLAAKARGGEPELSRQHNVARRMMALSKMALGAVIIAYPFIVYLGLGRFDPPLIAIALVFLALARLIISKYVDSFATRLPHGNLIVALMVLVGISTAASNSPVLLLYYPVCVNALLFLLFFVSLFRPPSVIEQIARIKTPDLPDAAIAYTRKVTMVWCGFFVLNGTMAFYTVTDTSLGFWAVYNGVISYSLMGILFVGEFIVRRSVQRNAAGQEGASGWR